MNATTTTTPVERVIGSTMNGWMHGPYTATLAIAKLVGRDGAAVLTERPELLAAHAEIDPDVDMDDVEIAVESIRAIAEGRWEDNDGVYDDLGLNPYIFCYSTDIAANGVTLIDVCEAFKGDVVAASVAIVRGYEWKCGRGASVIGES